MRVRDMTQILVTAAIFFHIIFEIFHILNIHQNFSRKSYIFNDFQWYSMKLFEIWATPGKMIDLLTLWSNIHENVELDDFWDWFEIQDFW